MKQMVQGIVLVTCWGIWKCRNELVFSGKRVHIDQSFGEVQVMAFLWYKNRAKRSDLD
ncbi:hypothetical protein HanIR_Chr17g0883651 [Helianthus annuus]|nr:hypothetical protein HanIR_Chr17g0883651 [Helianthus annuus]